MASTNSSAQVSVPRQWLWPFIYLSVGLAVTVPVAMVCAGLVYFAIVSESALSVADASITFGAGIVLCFWVWLAFFAAKLFFRRKSPLVIVENDGLRMPYMRPKLIAWDQVASVEQVKSGQVVYLRLRLASPNDHLSYLQRFVKMPYGDSILITLGFDESASHAVAVQAVKEAHSKYQAHESAL